MAYQVPPQLPTTLAVGATWTWDRRLPDYPGASGWVLVAEAVGLVTRLQITGTASGLDWRFGAPASATQNMEPGLYRVTVVATLGSEVRIVEAGDTRVLASPTAATPGDGLTFDERMVRAIEAELERRISGNAVASYSIAGRSLTFEAQDSLYRQLSTHRAAVRRSRGVQPPSMRVSFGASR